MLFVGLACAEPAADADPSVLYGGYYGYPYGLYGGLYGGLYRPWGAYHLIGKRSADSEPEAKADPSVLYGGYYGYPYAYRTLGYPLVWGK